MNTTAMHSFYEIIRMRIWSCFWRPRTVEPAGRCRNLNAVLMPLGRKTLYAQKWWMKRLDWLRHAIMRPMIFPPGRILRLTVEKPGRRSYCRRTILIPTEIPAKRGPTLLVGRHMTFCTRTENTFFVFVRYRFASNTHPPIWRRGPLLSNKPVTTNHAC